MSDTGYQLVKNGGLNNFNVEEVLGSTALGAGFGAGAKWVQLSLGRAVPRLLWMPGIGIASRLFGRAGTGVILNDNPWLRCGWGWKGPANAGHDVFRIGIGSKPVRPHIDLFRGP